MRLLKEESNRLTVDNSEVSSRSNGRRCCPLEGRQRSAMLRGRDVTNWSCGQRSRRAAANHSKTGTFFSQRWTSCDAGLLNTALTVAWTEQCGKTLKIKEYEKKLLSSSKSQRIEIRLLSFDKSLRNLNQNYCRGILKFIRIWERQF